MRATKILVAELIGTFILMLGGPGLAVLAAIPGSFGEAGNLAVALGFGFSLLIIAYSVGPISGGHVNPAVTLGLFMHGKVDARLIPSYLIGQVVGSVVGGLTIWVIATNASNESAIGRVWPDGADGSNFATNRWTGEFMGFWPMVIVEIVFTALLVFTVLSTTSKDYASPGAVGLHVGMVLTLIHLVTIPVDNTSVNPVRSLGMAIFAGGDSLSQLWAFIVFPLVGAVVGALAWMALSGEIERPGSDDGDPLSSARKAAARATASVQEAVDE
jgi:aquaporin Z